MINIEKIEKTIEKINGKDKRDVESYYLIGELLEQMSSHMDVYDSSAYDTMSTGILPVIKKQGFNLQLDKEDSSETPIIKGHLENDDEEVSLVIGYDQERRTWYGSKLKALRLFIQTTDIKNGVVQNTDCLFSGDYIGGFTEVLAIGEDRLVSLEKNDFSVRFYSGIISKYGLRSKISDFTINGDTQQTRYDLNVSKSKNNYSGGFVVDEAISSLNVLNDRSSIKQENRFSYDIISSKNWKIPNIPLFTSSERTIEIVKKKTGYQYKPFVVYKKSKVNSNTTK